MIARATPADLDQVLRIERAAFSAPHWPWEAYEQMLEDSDEVQRVLLVETQNELVLGFAGGSVVAGEAQLESIAVSEAARRQGLGRALCAAFMEWAAECSATSISLELRAASEGVQKLYVSLGFQAVGRRPRYYSNPVEDGILMRCLLAPRPEAKL